MTPVEPAVFAAELIARLEKVKQEQETMHSLEERLQQIKEVRGAGAYLPARRVPCFILPSFWHTRPASAALQQSRHRAPLAAWIIPDPALPVYHASCLVIMVWR